MSLFRVTKNLGLFLRYSLADVGVIDGHLGLHKDTSIILQEIKINFLHKYIDIV